MAIYILGLVELEKIKTYIQNNRIIEFIKLFKFSAKTPIIFNQKLNGSLK